VVTHQIETSIVCTVVGQTWLKNKAKCASSTALSTSASSHTMKGDFPPSSNVTAFRLLFAASSSIILPVSVDPVKAICKQYGVLITALPQTYYTWHTQYRILVNTITTTKCVGNAIFFYNQEKNWS